MRRADPPAECRRGRARDRPARRAGCSSAAARRRDRSRTAAPPDRGSRRSRGRSSRPPTRRGCRYSIEIVERLVAPRRRGPSRRLRSSPRTAARGRPNCATSGASARPCGVSRRAAFEAGGQLPPPARHLDCRGRRRRSPISSTASSTARQKSHTATIARRLAGRQDQERVVEVGVSGHKRQSVRGRASAPEQRAADESRARRRRRATGDGRTRRSRRAPACRGSACRRATSAAAPSAAGR